MDPLSVTASVVAIVGAAGTVSLSIKKLLSLRGTSDAVLALNNEVSDLQLVLQGINALLQKKSSSIQPEIGSSIRNTSNQATKCLQDLNAIIDFKSMSTGKVHGKPKFNRTAWFRQHRRIQRIQEDLRSLRTKLITALGILNSFVYPSWFGIHSNMDIIDRRHFSLKWIFSKSKSSQPGSKASRQRSWNGRPAQQIEAKEQLKACCRG